uniref:HTH psq-type domain-containing protein n=1 Tax=Heterorhabditis bacteriophora TaxID=37862 RepID=A0A1I7WNY7_HETBA
MAMKLVMRNMDKTDLYLLEKAKRMAISSKRLMRKVVSDFNISLTSKRRIVKHELGDLTNPYVDEEQEDEKILTVNLAFNSQNSRQLLQRGHQRSEKASVNSRSHFPSSGMVWAGQDEVLMKVMCQQACVTAKGGNFEHHLN